MQLLRAKWRWAGPRPACCFRCMQEKLRISGLRYRSVPSSAQTGCVMLNELAVGEVIQEQHFYALFTPTCSLARFLTSSSQGQHWQWFINSLSSPGSELPKSPQIPALTRLIPSRCGDAGERGRRHREHEGSQ